MRIPTQTKVTLIRGDTVTFTALLKRDGMDYIPSPGCVIIFTAKRDPFAPDTEALFQKLLGINLMVSGSIATIYVYPGDTLLAETQRDGYYADIQVQEPSGAVLTVWLGKLVFTADITREYTVSVPLNSTNPPVSGGDDVMANYNFVQTDPSDLWVIDHNLGIIVATTVFDTTGTEVEVEVTNPTLNQTRVLLSSPLAGRARCM